MQLNILTDIWLGLTFSLPYMFIIFKKIYFYVLLTFINLLLIKVHCIEPLCAHCDVASCTFVIVLCSQLPQQQSVT